jgi:hypothetical protein
VYGVSVTYVFILRYKYNIGFLKFLSRFGFNLAFMIIWNIYIIFIKKNEFELEISYIVIITNIWLAISKTLVIYNFKNKLKLNINNFEDVRL